MPDNDSKSSCIMGYVAKEADNAEVQNFAVFFADRKGLSVA